MHNNYADDDLVTVYHFTDEKAYKAITSQKDITIKVSKPKKPGNPTAAYFSKEGPDELGRKAASKLQVSAAKTQYVIEAQVPASKLKALGNNVRTVFSLNDVTIPSGFWSAFVNPNYK